MSNPKKQSHVYDYVIVGAGLSGLCLASALSKKTSNIALVEASEFFGGFNRSISTALGPVNNGLRFLPGGSATNEALFFLESLLGISLNISQIQNPPLCFESGSLRPFVGFGELSPIFYDDLSYFLNPVQLKTMLEPHEWTPLLFNQFSGDFLNRSFVTKFTSQSGRVTSALINGQKTIFANEFIYAGNIKDLALLLPEEALSIKAKTKLAKGPHATALCLDLVHNHRVTDQNTMFLLSGTQQDELDPSVGQFYEATQLNDQTVQFSQWVSFIEDAESEDTEVIGLALKRMKRQMKRAFPESLENLVSERICVAPAIGGSYDLKINDHQKLSPLENFYIASGSVNPQKNLIGSLKQSLLVAKSLDVLPDLTDSSSELSL